MIYLSEFEFPHIETEYAFLGEIKRTCYDTVYPFQVLSRHQLQRIEFAPVTILYGGNGNPSSPLFFSGAHSITRFTPSTISSM